MNNLNRPVHRKKLAGRHSVPSVKIMCPSTLFTAYCCWSDFAVFLSSDTSDTGAVEIGSIVRVHGSMNAHILNVVEVFLSLERV